MAPIAGQWLESVLALPAHLLAQGQGAAIPPKAKAAAAAGGGWLDPVNLLINVSTLLLVGIFIGAIVFLRGKLAARRPDPNAESDFERQVLSELNLFPATAAPPSFTSLPPAGATAAALAPASETGETDAAKDEAVRLSTTPAPFATPSDDGGDASAQAVSPPPDGAAGAPPVEAAFDRLTRLRPDVVRTGLVGALGDGLGQGIAVAWDNRHAQAVIVASLPPAAALHALLRRFDAVIVAPDSAYGEPIIVDRLSAYFFRGLALKDH